MEMVGDLLDPVLSPFLVSTSRAPEIPIGPTPRASILFCITEMEATFGYIRARRQHRMLSPSTSPAMLQSMLWHPVCSGCNCQCLASSRELMLLWCLLPIVSGTSVLGISSEAWICQRTVISPMVPSFCGGSGWPTWPVVYLKSSVLGLFPPHPPPTNSDSE